MILADVHREYESRLEVFGLFDTSECTMREFIGPVLIGAIRLMGDRRIKIESDQIIEGRRGRGPVDYDVVLRHFHIVVCEVKNGADVISGIPQNGAQLLASRENIQIKKRSLENEIELREELDKLPSFGIVSTGYSWVFICYYKDSDGKWQLKRSSLSRLPLSEKPEERAGLKVRIQSLLGIVVGIMLAQKDAVEEFERTADCKRPRTSSTGEL